MDDLPTHTTTDEPTAPSLAPLAPQDPALQQMFDVFWSASLKLPLVREYLRGGSASRPDSKPNLTSLQYELGIESGGFSRWKNGTLHSDGRGGEHLRTTKILADLFGGRSDAYYSKDKARQALVRAFREKLIGHWTATHLEFISAIVEKLDAHAAYLRQHEEIEAEAKLRGLTASGSSSLAAHERPEGQYVRRLTPKSVPSRLHPVYAAFGRERIVAILVKYFEAPESRNRLVTLKGPAFSGKSAVVRALVGELARRAQESDRPPSLLYVNLADAETPQRALYLALGGRAGVNPSRFNTASSSDDTGGEDDLDRDAAEWGDAISFVQSALPQPDLDAGQLVVFEGYAQIAATEEKSRQIQSLIEQTGIKTGFVLIETQGSEVAPRAMVRSSVQLPPLEELQAIAFLTGPCQVPADLAGPAIADLVGFDELFHPGPLHFGSGEFRSDSLEFRTAPPDPQELCMSILNAATGIVEKDVLDVLRPNEHAAQKAMQSLMAMSVIAMAPISDEFLAQSRLHPIPREALRRMGWFSHGKESRLLGFALHALRAAAARQLANATNGGTEVQCALEEDVKRLVMIVGSDGRSSVDLAIEEAAAWLDRTVPQDNPLLIHLRALLFQASVQDDVSPLSEEKEVAVAATFRIRATENLDLDNAISALVIASRRTGNTTTTARDSFDEALDGLMNILRANVTFDLRQLSAIDGALHYGVIRYHTLHEVLVTRRRILAMLDGAEPDPSEGDQVAQPNPLFLEAVVSFKINTAENLTSYGDLDAAQQIAGQIRSTLNLIPEDERTSFTHWKLARLAMLRSRLAQEIGGRCRELERACRHAQDCLREAPKDMRTSRFLLRTVRRYLDVEGSAEPRQQIVGSTIALLEELYGQPENWNSELRGRLASLLLRTVRLERNIEAQKEIAREGMRILVPTEKATNDDLDALGLLTKARLYAILGETSAALAICSNLTETQPSVEAWMLKLRLEDGETGVVDDPSNAARFEVNERAQISDRLLFAIRDAENWAKDLPAMELQSPRVARLLLWTKSRRWKAEGSIERSVRYEVEKEGKDFSRLRIENKVARLNKEFRKRESALNGIGRLCPRSADLIHAKARNCSQFVRSKAVLSGREPEVDNVLEIYQRGLSEMSNSAEILFYKAEYQRYIWRTDDAIFNFREVLNRSDRADLRQAAALSLAKTLHVTAVELEHLPEAERRDRLTEAKALAGSLSDTPSKVPEILLLKEHLAFELGESVDWVGLDTVCENVAGEVNGYLPSLLRNLELLKLPDDEVPQTIADALVDNFTSREVLGSVARLYFRRGMKDEGNDAHSYFTRAISLQCAVAMQERSWLGTELATTRFYLARTVSVAADRLGSPNPIEGLWIGEAKDQLRFAGSKFHAAMRASAGQFRTMAKNWQGIVDRQRQAMGASG